MSSKVDKKHIIKSRRFLRNKKKIIAVGIAMILMLIILILSLLVPKIKFEYEGKTIQNINLGEDYSLLKVKAYYQNFFEKKELTIKTSDNVNPDKVGRYFITFEASFNGKKKKIIQVVNVIDNVKPEITINGNVTVCKNGENINFNATATDNYDGDITDKIKYRVSGEVVYLTVEDSSGNKTEIKSSLKYLNNEKPTITLNSSETIYLNLNEKYEEYGAVAKDSCDGDISKNIKISGNVDASKEGEYEIKYEIKDSDGNSTSKTRRVVVLSKEDDPKNYVTDGTIYLTFDDGPGKYTAEILDILAKNNIKATFFVTGQFPKYYDLITREYNEGHTIGIHTYSHKWNIYSSVETYLDDFNKIETIIYEKTGMHPKYFRFPGGSSNTVSRNYCDKIMTNLAKVMEDKGYTYFDWTFDSCDTCKNNSKEDILKMVKTYLKGNGDYIILMHDIKENTKKALPEVIEYAKSRGYVFKAIDENTPVKHFKIAN